MSADTETTAELRRLYYGGKQALNILERTVHLPREPHDRAEIQNAMRLLNSLVNGYAPSESR
jgi:hypothetical protein